MLHQSFQFQEMVILAVRILGFCIIFVIVGNGNCFFIFGGQDNDNNKLNDLWKFDYSSSMWEEIADEDAPEARSGHTVIMLDSKVYIFGGIHEITNELNDTIIFDTETMGKTYLKDEDPNHKQHLMHEDTVHLPSHSGTKKGNDISPSRKHTLHTLSSPSKKG